MAQEEPRTRLASLESISLDPDVVPEPLGLLVGVGVAANPGKEAGVVDDRARIGD